MSNKDYSGCNVSVCEYWTTNNNCKRCESDCINFDGFCRLLENLKPCYLVDNCYYKQLQAKMDENTALKQQLDISVEALEFYADGKNWLDACTPYTNMDKNIAKTALEKAKGATHEK